jgi:hypothetical protein
VSSVDDVHAALGGVLQVMPAQRSSTPPSFADEPAPESSTERGPESASDARAPESPVCADAPASLAAPESGGVGAEEQAATAATPAIVPTERRNVTALFMSKAPRQKGRLKVPKREASK